MNFKIKTDQFDCEAELKVNGTMQFTIWADCLPDEVITELSESFTEYAHGLAREAFFGEGYKVRVSLQSILFDSPFDKYSIKVGDVRNWVNSTLPQLECLES